MRSALFLLFLVPAHALAQGPQKVVDAMGRLLEAGADPNAASDGGSTALMLAIHDADKTRLLLEAGANPNVRPDDGRTALIVAASQFGSSSVVKLLLDRGANARALTPNRTTALRLAAGAGDVDVMRLLIERGGDVSADAAAALTQALLSKCRACADLVIQQVERPGLGDAPRCVENGQRYEPLND